MIYGKNEYVPVVERSVQTIKEKCRVTCRAAPYTKYTSLMVQYLVQSRVSWLNKFPSKNGISTTMSPATIVLGQEKPDITVRRIPFGAYAMAYTQTSNDMKTRAVPGIALAESNKKGGQYFMSLYTGKRIHAFGWQELPIHDEVIKTVEQFAKDEDQPKMIDREPLFEWEPGFEITNENEDECLEDFHNEEQLQHDENLKEDVNHQDDEEFENLVTDDEDTSDLQPSEDEFETTWTLLPLMMKWITSMMKFGIIHYSKRVL